MESCNEYMQIKNIAVLYAEIFPISFGLGGTHRGTGLYRGREQRQGFIGSTLGEEEKKDLSQPSL